MAKYTKIDWTDHTWNPWQGCRKVSPGCTNCYMYRDKKRFGQNPFIVTRSKKRTFDFPLRITVPGEKIFVCSWSDFFIEDADPWRPEAWDIIRCTPHLTYQILTKRPENIKDRLPADWPLKNVWLGVTAENQEVADKRIPILLKIPAAIRFISVEPMLGLVDLGRFLRFENCVEFSCNLPSAPDCRECPYPKLDWVICGGESGPAAREMNPHWAWKLLQQCKNSGVAFFMKQMTGKRPIPEMLNVREFPDMPDFLQGQNMLEKELTLQGKFSFTCDIVKLSKRKKYLYQITLRWDFDKDCGGFEDAAESPAEVRAVLTKRLKGFGFID